MGATDSLWESTPPPPPPPPPPSHRVLKWSSVEGALSWGSSRAPIPFSLCYAVPYGIPLSPLSQKEKEEVTRGRGGFGFGHRAGRLALAPRVAAAALSYDIPRGVPYPIFTYEGRAFVVTETISLHSLYTVDYLPFEGPTLKIHTLSYHNKFHFDKRKIEKDISGFVYPANERKALGVLS